MRECRVQWMRRRRVRVVHRSAGAHVRGYSSSRPCNVLLLRAGSRGGLGAADRATNDSRGRHESPPPAPRDVAREMYATLAPPRTNTANVFVSPGLRWLRRLGRKIGQFDCFFVENLKFLKYLYFLSVFKIVLL